MFAAREGAPNDSTFEAPLTPPCSYDMSGLTRLCTTRESFFFVFQSWPRDRDLVCTPLLLLFIGCRSHLLVYTTWTANADYTSRGYPSFLEQFLTMESPPDFYTPVAILRGARWRNNHITFPSCAHTFTRIRGERSEPTVKYKCFKV